MRRFADGFSDPADVERWFLDPAKSQQYLAAVG
jgi:hypothetical protein